MNKTDKLLWMYMIKNGNVGAKWSFYGGCYSPAPEHSNDNLYASVKEYGVDWKKTQPVEGDRNTEFNGTFCEEDSWVEVLEGTLYLTNGDKYRIGTTADTPEVLAAMDSYIIDCFEDLK